MVEATGVFRGAEVPVALEVFDTAVAAPGVDYWAVGAYADELLIGFATFGPVPCTVATWDLYWIVVDPAAHVRGVGRRLMARCEQTITAEGGRLVVVETSSRDDYRAARRFYERLGYDARATIPEYYAPGDDLVVYIKGLDPADHGTAHG